MPKKSPWQERFWPKVDKNGPIHPYSPSLGVCWLWTACVDKHGYGQMNANRSMSLAHRLSWELHTGTRPVVVEHTCNNRRCVNPSHLKAGTTQSNNAYMVACGRCVNLRGEAHGRAVLSPHQVSEIRAKYADGVVQLQLAADYRVSRALVSYIVNHKLWRNAAGVSE